MERVIRVVLMPWFGFGHLMPFYELSLALAKAGVRVSFVSTPKNIQRLPKTPPLLAHLVNFVSLPFPEAAAANLGLPSGAESTVDVPGDKVPSLMTVYDLLQHPFKELIAEQSPDWIVTDVIPYWTITIGQELNVPVVFFSAFSAANLVFWGPPEYLSGDGRREQGIRSSPEDLISPPPWVNFPSSVAYRRNDAITFDYFFYTLLVSGYSFAERAGKVLDGCKAVAVRSCKDIEGEYFDLMAGYMGKPVISVGVLPPESSNYQSNNDNNIVDESWRKIFKWLDEQQPKSVVFVGFGSEGNKLSKEEIHEIANGLQLSDLPFLWALGKPTWAADVEDDSDPDPLLPPGFCSGTSQRGKVCIGWAPQNQLLAHPAIGASLFHAGWGSVMENLQYGHCLVVLPITVDQPLNARLIVDKGLGIEVERSEDGKFSQNHVTQALRKAMASTYSEGGVEEGMKGRVRKAAAAFHDQKLQDQHIAGFVEYLKKGIVTGSPN